MNYYCIGFLCNLIILKTFYLQIIHKFSIFSLIGQKNLLYGIIYVLRGQGFHNKFYNET